MANVYDISIEQGSSFNLNLTAKDSNGVPLNLVGYTVTGGIKYGYGSTQYLANLNPQIQNPNSGLIKISLSPTETSLLPVTKAVYDIEVNNVYYNSTFKAIRGYVEIIPEVTNM